MKPKVYFISVSEKNNKDQIKSKLQELISKSNILSCVDKNDKIAIKIHFGEEGNTGFVNPEYVRIVTDAVKEKDAAPFLSDTNTLYKGRRTNSKDHLALAHEHGFTPEAVGCEVMIPDDTQKENISDVKIDKELIKTAKIATCYVKADLLLSIAHFKGHMMTGFGGSIKNIAMGCATREGKLHQHSDISPFVRPENCTACEACIEVCPVDAISMLSKKAHIDRDKCIGCANCIAACNFQAIDVDWFAGAGAIQQKMAEYAYAVLKGKEKKRIFFNFATKITAECDCLAKDDPRIGPDIGIFVSDDPVAIDKAAYDLVVKASGKDIFKKAHPHVASSPQLRYAQELGLGSSEYELIKIDKED